MWDVSRKILILLASLIVFTGCEGQDEGQIDEEGNVVEWPYLGPDADSYVCNPIVDPDGNGGGSNEAPSNQGLIANLFYLAPDLPNYTSVDDYLVNGTQVDFDIYFNQINVPTRPFDRGFETVAGTTIMTPEGDTLYEWFALQFEGKIKLRDDQAPGDYQFSVLADDGAILEMDLDGDGTYETVVDNDGKHPTKMGCSDDIINFAADTEYNFRLKYFQGPRYHISVVLMMRPLPADPSDYADARCGQQGNSLFFDSTQTPPAPQAAYLDLLDRDWEVLEASNFMLPGDTSAENPCLAPAPTLSAVEISNVSRNSLDVLWYTDVPSISIVEIQDIITGQIFRYDLGTEFGTTHQVTADGLTSNRLYNLRVISTSTSGLFTISTPDISFRTSR